MFCRASRSFPSYGSRRACTARYFHRVTTDFINYDARGNLVARRVPVIIGNPGESYVLIDPGVGRALCAASPCISPSAASAEDRCQLTFFHDSQHFGFGSSSYPRLYVPSQIPRQRELNISPATLFLSGKMHEIVLDGTLDANFAENASATGRNLERVIDQLKDMRWEGIVRFRTGGGAPIFDQALGRRVMVNEILPMLLKLSSQYPLGYVKFRV